MSNPSILILDTYYPEFLKSAPLIGGKTYEQELDALMKRCFGTYDCYSRGLMTLGWDTEDAITNHTELLRLKGKPTWSSDHDVLFAQDLSHQGSQQVLGYKVKAGQLSCAWPGDDIIRCFDILFTSFPHYVPRIEALGVKAVYVPLAFDPVVFERLMLPVMPGAFSHIDRDEDWAFVGGLGEQFGARHDFLIHIERQFGSSLWGYGCGHDTVEPLWGLDMYRQYARSKIVLNIHHPAAEGYSNNLRMFEATGMGALLVTEDSPNIHDFFEPGVECITYRNPTEAAYMIKYYLGHEPERLEIAAAGHLRTLTSHTYLAPNRLPVVDRELRTLLESKKGK